MSNKCRNHCAELRRNEQAVQPGNRITTRFATERHTKQKGSIPFARSRYEIKKPCFYRAFLCLQDDLLSTVSPAQEFQYALGEGLPSFDVREVGGFEGYQFRAGNLCPDELTVLHGRHRILGATDHEGGRGDGG